MGIAAGKRPLLLSNDHASYKNPARIMATAMRQNMIATIMSVIIIIGIAIVAAADYPHANHTNTQHGNLAPPYTATAFAKSDPAGDISEPGSSTDQLNYDITPHMLHTVRVGLYTADALLDSGDASGAAYAAQFASEQFVDGLQVFREKDRGAADEIHITLLDVTAAITDNNTEQNRDAIRALIRQLDSFDANMMQSDAPLQHNLRLDVVHLLSIAEEQYRSAWNGDKDTTAKNEAAYMISQAIFADAHDLFMASFDDAVMRDLEIQSFFKDLMDATEKQQGFVAVGTLVSAIQRDLLEIESTMARDHSAYFANIRVLYEDMRGALYNGDYDAAQEHAIEAYLENFEYLEPTLEAADAEFMYELEVEMREDLRGMISRGESADEIIYFLDDTILPKLDRAESITIDHIAADVAAAAAANAGLMAVADTGTITKAMGDTTTDEQSAVRSEIDFIRISLNELVVLYEAGDYESAYVVARTAYLDSYEHVEIPLRPIAPDFTLEVEHLFAELRNAIRQQAPPEEVRSLAMQIDRNLDESERLVTGTGQVAPAIAFTASFAIIFREGLEAVLILGAIMTYLEASRNNRFKPYVHYGVVAAIGATAVTWFVASYIIEISGASRELIEAIAALSATAVLFYVSFWILNKIEHKKWMEFVKAKVWQATTTGSVMVFVMLSFFTVYREGFETVLFYQAMFGFAKYMEMYVGLGFVLGLASLFAIYYVMRLLGKRLPLRVLFGLTMGIGAYLSIAFLGNAIRELQVLDIVPYTSMLGVIPRLDINMATMTGIYPTLETVIGQIVLLCIYLVASVYILILRPRKERMVAAMRQSRRKNNNAAGDNGGN